MTFKKDYINYLLYTVVNSPASAFRDNYRLSKLADTIIANDDVMKTTYLIGKTAGLDLLFKYLLYISDKIDKSQVTIFNLKDNFDYDRQNLEKICSKINIYRSENVQDAIKQITNDKEDKTEEKESADNIIIETTEEDISATVTGLETIEVSENETEDENEEGLTLIENPETNTGEDEVFELESISDYVENSGKIINEDNVDLINKIEEEKPAEIDDDNPEETDTELTGGDLTDDNDETNTDELIEEVIEPAEKLPELEIEVHKPMGASQETNVAKEEAITNEAYYKFETKFFEEVKILEKLLASVSKECVAAPEDKLNDKCLQGMTEILGITSELSSLSRQLSFDLLADIFLTMNIYFTKSISKPGLLNNERIKLFDSSLALVNSLIKGEDYLNYDNIVERIEKLKKDISNEKEVDFREISDDAKTNSEDETTQEDTTVYDKELNTEENQHVQTMLPIEEKQKLSEQQDLTGNKENPEYREYNERPSIKKSQMETALFKLKYLIKEFEKSFASISGLKGEYSRFDALEKISELNNALRLIAKISAAIKNNDVLKLAEVTYVFLKYVKDYRMDMQEPEVQQIIKYIIFTFKMLLTSRKPEDFNVLVQHLNNPVKIFADS